MEAVNRQKISETQLVHKSGISTNAMAKMGKINLSDWKC